ncbi:helix-turn-helix transcriptional regulator [Micromonospora tarapacensis]|uniref:helix-turn-helix transcriptional regulator n=1 Tax=Micromonospora tarapacensis TaxID=2835305 RepID=UPI002F426A68
MLRTELLSQPHTRRIRLNLLSPDGVARVLGGPARPVTGRTANLYHHLTGGNPLLLHGLAADQQDPHALPMQVANGFTRAVESCLYNFEAPVLQVARSIAVLGEQVSTMMLSQLTGLQVQSVARAVDLLTRTGLLDDSSRLRHVSAVEAVLDGMSSEERSDLHRRTARLLNQSGVAAPVVAAHLVASAPPEDTWAVPVLREAADRSVDDGMFAQALEYLNLAHRITPDKSQRASIKTALARVEWRISPASALLHLTDVIPVETNHVPPHDAIMLLRYLAWYGRTAEASRVLDWLDDHRTKLSQRAASELFLSKMIIACLYPNSIQALQIGKVAEDGPRRPDTLPVDASFGIRAGDVLIAALSGDSADSVVAHAEQILQQIHVDGSSAAAMSGAVAALLYTEGVDRAVPWSTSLAAHPSGDRSPTWRALCTALRAEISLRTGDLPAAERLAAGALRELPQHDWGLAIGVPLSCLLSAKTSMGKYRECERYLRIPLPRQIFDTLFGLHFLEARGRYHLAAGRAHAALSDFLTCGNLMRGWNVDRPGVVAWRLRAADAYLHMRRTSEARTLVEEQLGLLAANETRTRGHALTLLAATTDLRGRPARLREAVELLRARGDRLGTAHALAALSRAYHALGDSAKARNTVRRAQQLAKECGAIPLSGELLPELSHSYVGAERATTICGERVATLSDAERRVASLAAYGHTNREISSKLFITVSTVEQHLTRIYRKLNVNSRAELSDGLMSANDVLCDESTMGA